MQLELATIKAKLEAMIRLNEEQKELKTVFKAIAEETLETTQSKWIQQAEKQFSSIHQGVKHDLEKKEIAFNHLVSPVKETLGKLEEKLQVLHQEKITQDTLLKAQLNQLAQTEADLMKETKMLSSALRNSSTRGFWGELTLKRIVELAGLVNHCDFYEQETIQAEDSFRPDMIVRLPNQRQLIVDAKVPLSAYLQALDENHHEHKKEYLEKHVKLIRNHINSLSKKSYFDKVDLSPEFVIMFLPVDQIYQIALEIDPTLIEYSALNNVIIATPMTLIGLLKSVHYAWKQEAISLNAKAISEQGEELLKTVNTLLEHLEKLGKSLGTSVTHFNSMIGSIESRFTPKAKRLASLVNRDEEIKLIEPIEKVIREITLN